jgi:hypothetical protein
MRTNLTAILVAMGAAALLAAPAAMAKTRHYQADDAYGAYGRYYGPGNEGGPYRPNAPTPFHGQSHDFQDGPRGE